jgi:hypothetical protein
MKLFADNSNADFVLFTEMYVYELPAMGNKSLILSKLNNSEDR